MRWILDAVLCLLDFLTMTFGYFLNNLLKVSRIEFVPWSWDRP